MLRRYTFWLSAAVLFQLITAVMHSFSFFMSPKIENETERQLYELVTTYRMATGDGFSPTFMSLFTAMSVCFTLVCLLGGLTLGYMLLKNSEPKLMKGLIAINLAVFGVLFVVMIVFTFLPPVVFTGLIFVNLLAAYIFVPRIESAV
ncbi:MAG: LIC_13387 family protein [Pyrinomonadaceae bacterium]